MPKLTNKMIIDEGRVTAEFRILRKQMKEMIKEFGLKKICNDSVFNKLEEDLAKICYPFLKGLQEINAKVKEHSEKLLT